MAQLPPRTSELAPDLARADDLPLGSQLAWRLRVLIASGQLGPGDRLPGVRELAGDAGVNVNTARSVYRRLEEDGLIVSRHGLGTFVAEDASVSPDLERLAAEAADSASAHGVDPRELARAIYAASGPGAGSVEPLEPGPEQLDLDAAGAALPEVDPDERPGRRQAGLQNLQLKMQSPFGVGSGPHEGTRAASVERLALGRGYRVVAAKRPFLVPRNGQRDRLVKYKGGKREIQQEK